MHDRPVGRRGSGLPGQGSEQIPAVLGGAGGQSRAGRGGDGRQHVGQAHRGVEHGAGRDAAGPVRHERLAVAAVPEIALLPAPVAVGPVHRDVTVVGEDHRCAVVAGHDHQRIVALTTGVDGVDQLADRPVDEADPVGAVTETERPRTTSGGTFGRCGADGVT